MDERSTFEITLEPPKPKPKGYRKFMSDFVAMPDERDCYFDARSISQLMALCAISDGATIMFKSGKFAGRFLISMKWFAENNPKYRDEILARIDRILTMCEDID